MMRLSAVLCSLKLHQFTQFISGESILLIFAITLEIASCTALSVATTLCAGQCLLFGKVFERKRILEGGKFGWCVLPVLMHIAAIACSLCLFRTIIRRGKVGSRSSYWNALVLLSISVLLTFVSSVIISLGFQKWCDSFVINRCSHEHIMSMDWKKFTPKYSKCGSVFLMLESSKLCSWCSCGLICVLCMTHIMRLFMGLPTSM